MEKTNYGNFAVETDNDGALIFRRTDEVNEDCAMWGRVTKNEHGILARVRVEVTLSEKESTIYTRTCEVDSLRQGFQWVASIMYEVRKNREERQQFDAAVDAAQKNS